MARIFLPNAFQAAWQAATDLYDQTAAKDKKFKRACEAYTAFRNRQHLWRQVAEYPCDNSYYPAARQGLTRLPSGASYPRFAQPPVMLM
jgi:hypothetical protein